MNVGILELSDQVSLAEWCCCRRNAGILNVQQQCSRLHPLFRPVGVVGHVGYLGAPL